MTDSKLGMLVLQRYGIARAVSVEFASINLTVVRGAEHAMAELLADSSVRQPEGKCKRKDEKGEDDVPARSWTWYLSDKSWRVYIWVEATPVAEALGASVALRARCARDVRATLPGADLPTPADRSDWLTDGSGSIWSDVALSSLEAVDIAAILKPALRAYIAFAAQVDECIQRHGGVSNIDEDVADD